MSGPASPLIATVWQALEGDPEVARVLRFGVDGALPSRFAVSELAAATVGVAGLAVAELLGYDSGELPSVRVDRRLASFWFASSIRPDGWSMPSVWDPIAGDYPTQDGWIRLHTNAPHHRAAAERVLGAHADRADMAPMVARWRKTELEAAIVTEGGCAAEMRTLAEWADHPQGAAVAGEPLVHLERTAAGPPPAASATPARPLAGIRVLDLTRVLAGPVASRFLAGYGADVLRLDPPDWEEPAVVPEVTLGKRCARIELKSREGRATFEALLRRADVLLHGYRSDALERLGLDAAARQRLRPGLVDVCLDAYGWRGPWRTRRGFDSLVQMSCGIAEAGMRWRSAERPVPLPVQALDHATGYLMAAAAVRGVVARMRNGAGTQARFSLARTAQLLVATGVAGETAPFAEETREDRDRGTESTPWGPAHRLHPPVVIEGAPMHWTRPACELGSALPTWA